LEHGALAACSISSSSSNSTVTPAHGVSTAVSSSGSSSNSTVTPAHGVSTAVSSSGSATAAASVAVTASSGRSGTSIASSCTTASADNSVEKATAQMPQGGQQQMTSERLLGVKRKAQVGSSSDAQAAAAAVIDDNVDAAAVGNSALHSYTFDGWVSSPTALRAALAQYVHTESISSTAAKTTVTACSAAASDTSRTAIFQAMTDTTSCAERREPAATEQERFKAGDEKAHKMMYTDSDGEMCVYYEMYRGGA
jgi:hypothetical protein